MSEETPFTALIQHLSAVGDREGLRLLTDGLDEFIKRLTVPTPSAAQLERMYMLDKG